MKSSDNTVFVVTGASGFIGAAFCDRLTRNGFPVVKLRVRPEDYAFSNDKQPEARDLPAHAIWVHLAGLREKEPKPLVDYVRANVVLTSRVIELALRSEARKFVHVSSVGVHGWPSRLPIRESSPMNPVGRYHFSKLLGERVVLRAVRKLGLPACIVRPAMVYGPGESSGFAVGLTRLCSRRFGVFPGNGKNRLHLVELSDVAEGLLLAAIHGRSDGGSHLLAGPRPCTLEELVFEIRAALGLRGACLPIPVWALRGPAMVGDAAYHIRSRTGLRLPGVGSLPTTLQLDLATRDRYYDIGRARLELGFEPKVDPATGIRRLADWMRKNRMVRQENSTKRKRRAWSPRDGV